MAKILVCEDNYGIRELCLLLLKMNNYEVDAVLSKKDLFARLKLFSPDLVLLAVSLAGYDGREICKEIKALRKDIKVILFTPVTENLENYNDCSVDGIIEKPFTVKNILQLIEVVLE